MSLKLTARLDQRMVLTPQLRQRIEMLQMTSLELNDLVQQEMLLNPVLEEVQSQDEVRELSENIIDHLADGNSPDSPNGNFDKEIINFESSEFLNGSHSAADAAVSLNGAAANDPGERNGATGETEFDTEIADFAENNNLDWNEEPTGKDAFEEIDYGREFQEYLDPGYRTQEIEHKEDAPSFE